MRSYSFAVSSTALPSRLAERSSVFRVMPPAERLFPATRWVPAARRSRARTRAFSSRMLKGFVR